MKRKSKKRKVKREINSAEYLRKFGIECARKAASSLIIMAKGNGFSLPLDDLRINNSVNKTIRIMNGAEKLDWTNTSPYCQTVFIDSMIGELQRMGIA